MIEREMLCLFVISDFESIGHRNSLEPFLTQQTEKTHWQFGFYTEQHAETVDASVALRAYSLSKSQPGLPGLRRRQERGRERVPNKEDKTKKQI